MVGCYDLPMALPPDTDPDELLELFGRDKKAIEGVTFVLDGPRGVEPVQGIPAETLRDAFEGLRA